MNRRDWFRIGTTFLRGVIGLVLAVPAASYLLTPLLRKRQGASGFTPITRLGDLTVGVPKAFPVYLERQDAWVKYPAEPVGTVWLVRQPEGAKSPVVALSAECPHLACQIKLSGDQKSFLCPCHDSHFQLDGERINKISPRAMDSLEVSDLDAADPNAMIGVKFERFRTMTEEKTPLG